MWKLNYRNNKMRCGVVARKLGMSRVFNNNGDHVPVTVLRMEDVEVLSIKTNDKASTPNLKIGLFFIILFLIYNNK